MPRRSKKSNQGCCLTYLVLWPVQIVENLINSIMGTATAVKPQPARPKAKPSVQSNRQSTTDRFVDVTPGSSTTPSIRFTINYEDSKTSFLKNAQKLHSKEGSPASHVPFKCYWPTYGDMNSPQQNWYFYWRSQARRGNYLPTDLSYIFVHVYEILNLVENPDPVQAADRMRTLWLAYRPTYPNLDRYLPDWGGDLLAVKAGGSQALAWWEDLLSVEGLAIPDPIINLIVEKAIRTNGLDHLPYKIWALLSDYQPRNKFYQRYNADHFVDLSYEKAIKVANDFYVTTTKKSLLDHFVSDRILNYEKQIFSSALIGFQYPSVVRLASGRDFAGSTRLADNITSIMKYAENILRKQLKFSAKLSGIELPQALAKELDSAFKLVEPKPKKPEPVRITLDPDRVALLQEESRVVSEMLATNQGSVEKALLTDLVEVRSLWKILNNFERILVADLFSEQLHTLSEIGQRYQLEAEKAANMLNAINNKGLPVIGDRLLYESKGVVSLAEDFVDELGVIIKEAPPDRNVSPVDIADISLDPWMQFFDKLEPVEVDVIKILGHHGQLSEVDLDSISRTYAAMGNAVMDSLNEKAQEHLSHVPFYTDAGIWLIEEDDLPMLRNHLGIEVN
jgi:hypothetical protein